MPFDLQKSNLSKVLAVLVIFSLTAATTFAAEDETLDDFLSSPARVRDIKLMALAILTQNDRGVADHNTKELRKAHWAAQPDSGLSSTEADLELMKFDQSWQEVAEIARERNLHALSFIGIDNVLLKKDQNWYFATTSARGPVLFRFSLQFNSDKPMTLFGVKAWTKWDDIKTVTQAIELKVDQNVLTTTYGEKKSTTTRPSESPEASPKNPTTAP